MAFFKDKRDGKERRDKITSGTVQDVLHGKSGNVTTVHLTANITAAAQVMADMKVGFLVVMDDNQNFAGVVAEREIVGALGHHGAQAADMAVSDIVNKNVTACTPETEISVILDTMKENYIRHVPIMVNGKVSELISLSDILRYLL